jgi:hypothetical protein
VRAHVKIFIIEAINMQAKDTMKYLTPEEPL